MVKTKEEKREYQRKWAAQNRAKNLEKIRAYQRQHYHKNALKKQEQATKWKKNNKDKVKKYRANYYTENKDKEKESKAKWQRENPELCKTMKRISDKKYSIKNADKIKERRKQYKPRKNVNQKEKYKSNIVYNIEKRLRASLTQALKKAHVRKTEITFDLIGCSPQKLKEHLEAQFLPGMSWERRNDIHIDHIKEVATFDLRDVEQQKQCFHYSNLRPLWAKDNLIRPKPKAFNYQQ